MKKTGKTRDLEELAEQVRYLMETEPGRTWKAAQIGDILGYRGGRLKVLRAALAELAEAGAVQIGRRETYTLGRGADVIEGKLEVVRSGAGFVSDPKSGRTLRVAAGETAGAMPGDIVQIRPVRVGRDAEAGRIVKVVSRGGRLICGTLSITGGGLFVTPIETAYTRDIAVPDAAGARDGDRVVVRFVSWSDPRANPRGEIVDVIGPADKPSLDTAVVCRQYDLPGDFPAAVLDEASEAEELAGDPGERLDLRRTFILTIDPASARDFDDALSLKVLKDGTRELGVHIADVSHFVRPGSALDAEAARRGNSVYLADKVIPMLPEQLSNGICSLRPHVDRLCFSVFLTFDARGRLTRRSFARSVIRSKLRLDYGQALAIIEGRQPEGLARVPKAASDLLAGVAALATELRAARMRRGALDLEVPECRVEIDADGRMTGFAVEPYDISHQLIEECMVAANEAVAAELAQHGRKIVSRLHEPPAPEKIADLQASLQALGFTPGDLGSPVALSHFIASIADHPLRAQAHTLILRSMKRAVYSSDGSGHFGLAKAFYAHFTSPIRRYPDLVLHRLLADYLGRRPASMGPGDLARVAATCTETEQRADEAERTLLEIKKYRFLQQQIDDRDPKVYDAVVSKVTSYGLFVDLPDLVVGGLVHISTISDRFVRYQPYDESLAVDGERYALGTKVKVHVAHVDFNARRLDFVIVRESGAPKRTPPPRGDKPRRCGRR